MLRILRKDLYRYNQLEQSEEAREEAREETGWKLISGDVFRPPKYAALLAVYVGSGVQVLGMSCCTIGFAVLGFLSPSNRAHCCWQFWGYLFSWACPQGLSRLSFARCSRAPA